MREKVDEKIKTSFDRLGIVHFTYKLPRCLDFHDFV